MKKITINQRQKGLLFRNGSFNKLLGAGKYRFFGNIKLHIIDTEYEINCGMCTAEDLLANAEFAKNTVVCEVGDNELALHYVDGRFSEVLSCGKHIFWNENKVNRFDIVDISEPEVGKDFPKYLFARIPSEYFTRISVPEYMKARLYYDSKFEKLLDPGTHYFWNSGTKVTYDLEDTRLMTLDLNGQEMLTKDKVTLRINFVCTYRITDFVNVKFGTDDYKQQLHLRSQLALRDYVGRHTLDELLENKHEMSKYVFEALKEHEAELYINVTEAGVRDIILPGEIRDIMNTVLIAEKKAQANVISRREEVASTRSLLNTAKLMDENKTLYKLKELEYIERICENVGNINLASGTDLRTLLGGILENNANVRP